MKSAKDHLRDLTGRDDVECAIAAPPPAMSSESAKFSAAQNAADAAVRARDEQRAGDQAASVQTEPAPPASEPESTPKAAPQKNAVAPAGKIDQQTNDARWGERVRDANATVSKAIRHLSECEDRLEYSKTALKEAQADLNIKTRALRDVIDGREQPEFEFTKPADPPASSDVKAEPPSPTPTSEPDSPEFLDDNPLPTNTLRISKDPATDAAFRERKISELEISEHLMTCLVRGGIETIGQLFDRMNPELMKAQRVTSIKGVGPSAVPKFEKAIADLWVGQSNAPELTGAAGEGI